MSGPFSEDATVSAPDVADHNGAVAPGKPLTVLQMITADSFTTAARSVRDVAGAIAAAGGRSFVAASGAAAARVRAPGSELKVIDANGGRARRRAISALTELSQTEGIDVIHAHDPASAEIANAVAKANGAHFVSTFHAPSKSSWRNTFLQPAMFQARQVITVSEALAQDITGRHGLTSDRITVVPRGTDMDVYAEEVVSAHRTIALADAIGLAEDARPVVLTFGRITKTSGHRALVRSVAQGVGADALFLLIGDDEDGAGAALETEIVAAGLGGTFRRALPVEDTPAALKLASLVCEVSPTHGGQVLIEAQAMGRPVIAPATAAAPEVMEDGSSGWLFPVGDEGKLAHILTNALAMDDSARAHIGMAGRARVRARFTLAEMLSATLAVYEMTSGTAFPNREYS